MKLLSHGLWADESRRMGKVIAHDFTTGFLFVVGVAVATRVMVWAVHGQ